MADHVLPLTDIRDNVQHLRKVHFSLLVACFALLSLALAREPNEFDKALTQLAEIRESLDAWDSSWVETLAAESLDEQADKIRPGLILGADCHSRCSSDDIQLPKLSLPRYKRPLGEEGLRLRVLREWTILPIPDDLREVAEPGITSTASYDRKSGPLWTRMAPLERRDLQVLNPVPKLYPVAYRPLDFKRPESVRQFQRMWDRLGTLEVYFAKAESPFWVAFFEKSGQMNTIRLSDDGDDALPLVDLWLEPLTESRKGGWRNTTEHQIYPEFHLVGHTPWGEVSVPVETEHSQFSLRAAFAKKHERTWNVGSFAMNFPDLSVAIRGVEDLAFDESQALLASESAKLAEDITVFGLTIPARVISNWGGAIIVIAQFYFWLHLRGLRRGLQNISGTNLAPWIGIYDDPVARVATAVSAFALPVTVVGLLIYGELVDVPALGLAILLSLILGVVSLLALRACWILIDSR